MKRLDSNTLAAVAATVTAVAALVVAVWDNVQSRDYNRISVRPYLVVEAQRETDSTRDRGEYVVSNQGVGPAVIRDVRLGFEGAGEGAETAEDWAELADEIRALGYNITGWTDLAAGRPVGVDHTIPLFSFYIERAGGDAEGGGAPLGLGRDVQDLIDALRIEIDYASIYGDEFTTGTIDPL